MKYIFSFFLLLLIQLTFFAQTNLVPNPSFEQYQNCPFNYSQITFANNWEIFRSSPDYFNACANYSSGVSVPKNDFGYQTAADGNGYAGLIGFCSWSENEWEVMGANLLSPLTVGVKYFLSFEVTLSSKDPLSNNAASNKMGMTFSKNQFGQLFQKPLNNSAKLFSNAIIQDTTNWVRISGSFIADSAYNYVMIGNFFNTVNTNTLALFPSASYGSYYFIDNVCVSTDSLYCASLVNVKENQIESSTKIFPNPNSGNFRIQLNNEIKDGELFLINSFGQKVYSQKSHQGTNEVKTSGLPSGLYQCILVGEDHTINCGKIMIE